MFYYDMHSHIKGDELESFKTKKELNINKSIVCIDPFIKELKCNSSDSHYCYINSNQNNEMIVHCLNCNQDIKKCDDVFFEANDNLFNIIKNDNDLYYFATLPVLKYGMNNLAEKYKNLYNDKLKGLKLYTGLSGEVLNNSEFLECDLPLLIHTGFFNNQKPCNMIDFLNYYKGKIILAHFCRFDIDTINKVKKNENIFFDISPALELYKRYKKKNIFLYNGELNSINEMFKLLIELVGIDKILWGSDFPYSDINDELQILLNSNLSDVEKEKILSINPKNFLEG